MERIEKSREIFKWEKQNKKDGTVLTDADEYSLAYNGYNVMLSHHERWGKSKIQKFNRYFNKKEVLHSHIWGVAWGPKLSKNRTCKEKFLFPKTKIISQRWNLNYIEPLT